MQVAWVLQSYLDGETDEITARRVAAHLEDCRRCGLEVAVYQEIKQSLARHEAPAEDAAARLRAFGETLLHTDRGGDADSGTQPPTSA